MTTYYTPAAIFQIYDYESGGGAFLERITENIMIEKLTKTERRKLKLQIERLCEKQYRKGVQRGAEFIGGRDLADRMAWTKSIQKWREYGERRGYKQAKTFTSGVYMPDGFLCGECAMDDMDELSRLLGVGL